VGIKTTLLWMFLCALALHAAFLLRDRQRIARSVVQTLKSLSGRSASSDDRIALAAALFLDFIILAVLLIGVATGFR
jgi:hypothetical protein